jgi:CubicO group peptidase (beta-lactamase class C family)
MLASCRSLLLLSFVLSGASLAQNNSALPAEVRGQVDEIANHVLADSGVPSASVALVQNGELVYAKAYGKAKLDPPTDAQPSMRYSIGSISKQFTAAAILKLQEQEKLSLDDHVSKYVPGLTRGDQVTIRQVLSHTSGYQDFWPQDYVPPFMLQSITPDRILGIWAQKPLDFDPGTQWQYSNTNYVIAGLIVEKVSGKSVLNFLSENFFIPLKMNSVMNTDQEHLTDTDATGYLRYALGPLRPSPKEGKGWMFAAGELAMPASELAVWDISMIDQSVLKPESYRQMETEVVLKNGLGTQYGLGVDVRSVMGHRLIAHDGEVSGFTATNLVFPDDRVAVAVLTNEDAVGASGDIARKLAPLLFARKDSAAAEQQARAVLDSLTQGKIDRSLFTSNANAYFTEQALADIAGSLGPLGAPQSFSQTGQSERGGMTFHRYEVKYAGKTIQIWERVMPDGKIEQFQILPGS